MLTLARKSPQPFYEQIREALRLKICGGELKAGAALPDERTLAAQVDVSRMTVRRAFVELAREGLLERVPGRGTFVRQSFHPARKKSKGIIALIGCLPPGAPNSFYYYRLVEAVALASESVGYPLVYRRISESQDHFVERLRREKTLRGAICIWIDEADTVPLKKLRIPIVLLESVQPAVCQLYDEVAHNATPGVSAAMQYLLQIGHRKIALLQSAVNPMTLPRRQAYEQALRRHDIAVDERLIFAVPFVAEAGLELGKQVLAWPLERRPTAILCAGDTLALGIFGAVTAFGQRIPADLSVVGFGDEGYFTEPPLHSIRVPIAQMGAEAVRLLLERLKQPRRPLQRLVLPTEFIRRASCAAPRDLALANR